METNPLDFSDYEKNPSLRVTRDLLERLRSRRYNERLELTRLWQYWMFSDKDGRLDQPTPDRFNALFRPPMFAVREQFDWSFTGGARNADEHAQREQERWEAMFASRCGSLFPNLSASSFMYLTFNALPFSLYMISSNQVQERGKFPEGPVEETYELLGGEDSEDLFDLEDDPDRLPRWFTLPPTSRAADDESGSINEALSEVFEALYGPSPETYTDSVSHNQILKEQVELATILVKDLGKLLAIANKVKDYQQVHPILSHAQIYRTMGKIQQAFTRINAMGPELDMLTKKVSQTYILESAIYPRHRDEAIRAIYLNESQGISLYEVAGKLPDARKALKKQVDAIRLQDWFKNYQHPKWVDNQLPVLGANKISSLLEGVALVTKQIRNTRSSKKVKGN